MVALQGLYQKSSSVGLLIGLLGFLVIFVPIHELFTFIKDYKSGIYVFIILMIGRILDMYSGLNGTIFSTSRKFKYDLYFTILLCVMVFTMNLWMIPKFGINGAAISTSFAYIAYNVLRCWYVYHLFGLQPFIWSQFKLIALFFGFVGMIELLEYFEVFKGMNVFLAIGSKEILVFVGFVLPIYFFNLEPEIVSYAKTMFQKLNGFIRKSKN
jgi:O-antigen/teichoic acid export membrane protein